MKARLLSGAAITAVSLGVYGATRFLFNIVALRAFGVEFVGDVASRISLLSIGAVLVGAPLGTTLVRFVASWLEVGHEKEAGSLATAGMIAGICASPVVVIVGLATAVWPQNHAALLLYGPLYLVYQIARGCYLASANFSQILVGEIIGTIGFLAVLSGGVLSGRPAIAAGAFLIQPCGLLLMSILTPSLPWRLEGLYSTIRRNARPLASFAAAALAVSALGVASFHLVIVLSGQVVGDPAKVGMLAVCLSALSPLGLLPTSVGMVLMPAQARRAAVSDLASQKLLVAKPICALQFFIAPLVGALILAAPEILQLLKLPVDRSVIFLWTASCLATFVSAASTPAGNYLNGSGRMKEQVILSLSCLFAAILGGWVALRWIGIAGGGVMVLLTTALPSWIRLWLAARSLRWHEDVRLSFWTGHLCPWVAAGSTVFFQGPVERSLVWLGLTIMLVPSVRQVRALLFSR